MVARLGLSGHTIGIERPRDGGWAELPWGGSVRPEDAIRYSARFGGGLFGRRHVASFTLEDAAGRVVWGGRDNRREENLAGNAWEDSTAPLRPGPYKLIVGDETPGVLGAIADRHETSRTYRVSGSAPAPPGGDGDWLSGITGEGGILGGGVPWPMIVLVLGLLLFVGIAI